MCADLTNASICDSPHQNLLYQMPSITVLKVKIKTRKPKETGLLQLSHLKETPQIQVIP